MTHKQKDNNTTTTTHIPFSLYAEAGVLAAAIIDNSYIPELIEKHDIADFYDHRTKLVFEAITGLFNKQGADGVDGLSLRNHLESNGLLGEAGGVKFLGDMLQTVPSAANYKYYSTIVMRKRMERDLVVTGDEIRQAVSDPTLSVEEKRKIIESAALSLPIEADSATILGMGDLTEQAIKSLEFPQTGMKTGYRDLDGKLNSMSPGSLIYLAARPSMGKSAFMTEVARRMAMAGHPQLIFSFEMSTEQLHRRIAAQHSQVSLENWNRGWLTKAQKEDVEKAVHEIAELPIKIVDKYECTPANLKAMAYRAQQSHDIEVVWIDYIQLMESDRRPGRKAEESRQQEVTTISRRLKLMARELDVPIVCLSQLNRSPDVRQDHRPKLSDLRESGSLEQDADAVMFLFREDLYRQQESDYDNKAEIILAKQRNGPTGTVQLCWFGEYCGFETSFIDNKSYEIDDIPF